jgi:hypothetical protein
MRAGERIKKCIYDRKDNNFYFQNASRFTIKEYEIYTNVNVVIKVNLHRFHEHCIYWSDISSIFCMRSSQMWMRFCRVFRTSDCQCQHCNSPVLEF